MRYFCQLGLAPEHEVIDSWAIQAGACLFVEAARLSWVLDPSSLVGLGADPDQLKDAYAPNRCTVVPDER